MSTDRQPLILPDDFDPEANLPGRDENGEVFHATIPGKNLAVDLMRFDLLRRWTEAGGLSPPMLESPLARQSRDGNLQVGGAELTCPGAPAWLYAYPGGERWAAVYHGPEAGPLRLAVPGGCVEIASLTTGIVVWDHGRVTVLRLCRLLHLSLKSLGRHSFAAGRIRR